MLDGFAHRTGGGSRILPLSFLVVLTLLWAGFPQGSAGQTVQGQILDKGTLAPVEGALALLRNEAGQEVDGALTNASGRFLLRAPASGTFTIQTDRIGYETITSDPFTLEAGQIFGIRLEVAEMAIQLEELRVEGEQKCVVRPEEGMEVARVWEEARKALTVQAWTEREGRYRFQVVDYQRDLDPNTHQVLGEARRVTTTRSMNPIQSLPAEDLMENGFIRESAGDSLNYFGPDASVLLSDVFLDTHCFRLDEDPRQPWAIGLAFEPVRRGSFRDIYGTLWLDRETGGLQFLQYGYTWDRYPEAQGVAQGRVEFRELPNGAWIVNRWWIRMPILAQDLTRAGGGRTGVYVRGIRETGGEIARISTLDRQIVAQMERGMVSGVVWDSTRSAPLAGARVYLSGTSYSGMADAQGRFLIERVPEGVFTASFLHPRLDTLGVLAPGVEVEIQPGELSEVDLGIPSQESVLLEACRGLERDWGSSVIAGTVKDQISGESIVGAVVRLEWQEVTRMGPGRLGGQNKWIEVPTDGEGRYTACSIPSNELITVRATFMERESDPVELRIAEDSFTVVDLEIEFPGES